MRRDEYVEPRLPPRVGLDAEDNIGVDPTHYAQQAIPPAVGLQHVGDDEGEPARGVRALAVLHLARRKTRIPLDEGTVECEHGRDAGGDQQLKPADQAAVATQSTSAPSASTASCRRGKSQMRTHHDLACESESSMTGSTR